MLLSMVAMAPGMTYDMGTGLSGPGLPVLISCHSGWCLRGMAGLREYRALPLWKECKGWILIPLVSTCKLLLSQI